MRWSWLPLALLACEREPATPTVPGDDDDDVTTTPTGDTSPPAPTDTPSEHTGHTAEHTAVTTPTGHTGEVLTPTADTGPFAWPPDPVADVIVDCNGGGNFTTIQAAIDASVSGMHIGVRPCRYTERIDYRGKSVDVFGIDGSATTILYGGGSGTVVRVARGESDGTRLAGFTITGGSGNDGGAIRVLFSTLELEDVILANNGNGSGNVLEADASRVTWVGGGAGANDVGAFGDVVDANGGVLALEDVSIACEGARSSVYTHNVGLVLDSEITCDGTYGWFVERGEILAKRTRFEGGGTAALWAEDRDDNRSENAVLINSAFVGGNLGAHVRYMDLNAVNSVFLGQQTGLEFLDGREDSHVHNSVLWGATCGLRGDPVLRSDVDWNLFAGPPSCNAHGDHTLTGDPMFVAAPDDLHPLPGSPL
ncbi:MAG: hypothetical protein KC621_28605, partial [Myxococcales bacterium]|nr:hypothetical protein [Myxococcales bacterium]